MNAAIAHRGPDGDGVHCEAGAGLGHRRLAIIDLEGGVQPLFNDEIGDFAIVFNGEIYNHRELAAELTGLGHIFHTRSDTEAILRAYMQWGADCVARLRGMFAFAIHDRRAGRLLLARDRLGMKPLYYSALNDGWLLFASEIGALLRHPDVKREIDPAALSDYLAYGYVPDPLSIYRGVGKLPPACLLDVQRGKPLPEPVRYWDLEYAPRQLSDAEALDELRAQLRDAVDSHLISDVPVGAFLSGGVDSAAVTAQMASLLTEPVRACTIGFDADAFDETPQARQAAAHLGAEHHLLMAQSDRFDLLDALAETYGEPFADSSALPTWLVCQLARTQTKVVLSGDGGDETLGGYARYRFYLNEERVRARIPAGVRRALFGPLGAIYPKLDWAPRGLRAKSTLQALARDAVEAVFHGVSVLDDDQRAALLSDDLQRAVAETPPVRHLHAAAARRDSHDSFLSRTLYGDLHTFLAGRVLVKVDRASMAHGLEVRAPLLDYRWAEWSARLPDPMKIRHGRGKWLLREGVAPLLPPGYLEQPKRGFSIPLAQWLRGPLKGRLLDALAAPALRQSGWFNLGQLDRLAAEHLTGRRDHGAALWSLLQLEAFLRRVHQGFDAASS
ncbi:putative asparagine synthase [Magnetofaba australis IT-1]|uniref:asparagine synthase (glutamine-hydrolyzing) n=2 Tax=Magnetofaba TaxID=1472292 RepID=A0A1Y2K800_9PROT|nr:putative asparagine synthase [Magnetofaba australis IT-1]